MSTITLETISRSIEDLTEIIVRFVPYVEKRFDGIAEEFIEIKGDIGGLKGEMREVKGVLYELDRHARITNERLTGVEDRLETVETKLDIVVFEVRDHDRRIVTLEQTARV